MKKLFLILTLLLPALAYGQEGAFVRRDCTTLTGVAPAGGYVKTICTEMTTPPSLKYWSGSEWVEFGGSSGGVGDALKADPLSQFAATTSLQLKGVISDETGSGALVFGTSPTLVTPAIGAATGTSLNLSGLTASKPLNTDASKNLASGTYSGNTTKVVTATGSPATDDCAKWDSNGNLTTAGAACGAGGSGGDASTNTSSSVDGEVALFSGTGGKTIKRSTLTAGVVKSASGVRSAAASADVVGLFGSGSCSGYLKSDGTCSTPSGNATTSNAYGSRPSAATSGNVFFPTDAYQISRDTGAAWVGWGPIYKFTTPVLADFTWNNQSTATATQTKDGIYMVSDSHTSTNIRSLIISAPSTPYTIRAFFVLTPKKYANYSQFGLLFRESGSGKLQTFGITHDASTYGGSHWGINSTKLTNSTTYSAHYTNNDSVDYRLSGVGVWLQIADNGTSRITSLSNDGQNWSVFDTQTRTDFLTADQVGFFVDPNLSTGSGTIEINLLSWEQL